jgi:hypothetical protein
MTNEIIALIANLALALSFIVGLVFGIAQVKTAARDRKERFTLETLRNFQTREFAELMFSINAYNIPPTLEENLSTICGEIQSIPQVVWNHTLRREVFR